MNPDIRPGQDSEQLAHKPGELFTEGEAGSLVHKLGTVKWGETPAGTVCEEYTAICGRGSQSWGMPTEGLESAVFISLEKAAKKMTEGSLEICPDCFRDRLRMQIALGWMF